MLIFEPRVEDRRSETWSALEKFAGASQSAGDRARAVSAALSKQHQSFGRAFDTGATGRPMAKAAPASPLAAMTAGYSVMGRPVTLGSVLHTINKSAASTATDGALADMPDPKDVAVLHEDAVNPDLRNSLIDARRRKPANAGSIENWERGISDLRAAIDDLIEREGFKYSALHRLLGARGSDARGNPAGVPSNSGMSVADEVLAGRKFAKGDVDEMAMRAHAIEVLMKAPMPESIRRELITMKNFFDDHSPAERRAMRNHPHIVKLLRAIERSPRGERRGGRRLFAGLKIVSTVLGVAAWDRPAWRFAYAARDRAACARRLTAARPSGRK